MIFLSATSGELAILDWIQEHMRCDVLDWFLPRFTLLANSGIFWVFVTLLLLSIKPYRSWGVEMAIAPYALPIHWHGVLKPLIARVRPFDANPAAPLIATPPTDYSLSFRPYLFVIRGCYRFAVPQKKLGRHCRDYGLYYCLFPYLFIFSLPQRRAGRHDFGHRYWCSGPTIACKLCKKKRPRAERITHGYPRTFTKCTKRLPLFRRGRGHA